MPFKIVTGDITKMQVDAIVNAACETLLGGGGVDGAIHRAAGPELLAECRALGGCKTGQAKLTGGYALPAKYVIHTVGPIYRDGTHGEREQLASCYRSSLALAMEQGCETVAFPLISSGAYGYPWAEAMRVAVQTVGAFLLEHELTVFLVLFPRAPRMAGATLFPELAAHIADQRRDSYTEVSLSRSCGSAPPPMGSRARRRREEDEEVGLFVCAAMERAPEEELDARLRQLDESFSQMLLRKIDEKGLTDAQCYKRANVDRKLFSKIRGDVRYRPSKPTVLAFAIALELSLEETEDMLRKAGFALSHSHKFDIIVEYFISRGNYDIFAINEALFAFDQSLLGA